jgi:hypothetical protein
MLLSFEARDGTLAIVPVFRHNRFGAESKHLHEPQLSAALIYQRGVFIESSNNFKSEY